MAAMTAAGRHGHMVVLGDSVAQGCDDPDPAGGWIGWAGRLADHLHIPREHVVNAAQRGAALADVAQHQLPAVRHLRPAIVLLNCGMNDALHGFDAGLLDNHLDKIFSWVKDTLQHTSSHAVNGASNGSTNPASTDTEKCAAKGALDCAVEGARTVAIIASVPLPPLLERSIFSDFRRARTRQRIDQINARLRNRAAVSGAVYLTTGSMPDVLDPSLWSPDGIHLNPMGHAYVAEMIKRVAGEVLSAQPISSSL